MGQESELKIACDPVIRLNGILQQCAQIVGRNDQTLGQVLLEVIGADPKSASSLQTKAYALLLTEIENALLQLPEFLKGKPLDRHQKNMQELMSRIANSHPAKSCQSVFNELRNSQVLAQLEMCSELVEVSLDEEGIVHSVVDSNLLKELRSRLSEIVELVLDGNLPARTKRKLIDKIREAITAVDFVQLGGVEGIESGLESMMGSLVVEDPGTKEAGTNLNILNVALEAVDKTSKISDGCLKIGSVFKRIYDTLPLV